MVRIESVREQTITSDGMQAILDLQVSEATDLPDSGDVVGGYKVAPGSIAQVIQSGAWYTLDDDEKWYDTDGNAAG